MKPNKILMCALAAGLMAFAFDKAQAVVINTNLYVPLNIKLTVNVTNGAGKLVQKTANSKMIINTLNYESGFNYTNGTFLAVGPHQHVYAIYKGVIQDDLSSEGYFDFNPNEYISTSTGTYGTTAYKYAEAGIVTFDFATDDPSTLDNNYFAFNATGTYTYSENDSAATSGLVKQSSKFSSSSLSGLSYAYELDAIDDLPGTGSISGSGSGKVAE